MNHCIKIFTICFLLFFARTQTAYSLSLVDTNPPPYYIQEMDRIMSSSDLSDDEKFDAIYLYAENIPEASRVVFHYMNILDRSKAIEISWKKFQNPEITRRDKLFHGRYLRDSFLWISAPNIYEKFTLEYLTYISGEVIHGGFEEFSQDRHGAITAVGEYIGIILNQKPAKWEESIDERTIQVLIQCLDVPDHAYDIVDVIYAETESGEKLKIGDPSGRNTQREKIPLVLAELKAIFSIPALSKIVKDHHDPFLQKNAETALSILVKIEDKKE